ANGFGHAPLSDERNRTFAAAQAARFVARATEKRAALADDMRKAADASLTAEVIGKLSGWITTEYLLPRCSILRCIFGNPFRPVILDPSWLTWNNSTMVKLAQGIYDERAFDRLPILADALQDAG